MNNTRTIDINSLTPGIFIVRGKLSYSRIARPIAGTELDEDIRRRRQQGRPTIDKPYTTATVYDASVHYAATQDMKKFAEEHFFTSVKKPGTYCFSATNKGNFKPQVSKSLDGGTNATQITMEDKELAQDTEVLLVVRIFKPKTSRNNGMTLDHVIVLGEPHFYTNARDEELKNAGITFIPNADPVPMTSEDVAPAPAPAPAPVAAAPQYAGTNGGNTAFAPSQTPFSSQQPTGFPQAGIAFKPEN